MKYLLNEKEYQSLTQVGKELRKQYDETLFDLCRRVCNNEPVRWTWGDGKDTPKPWGCIKDDEHWHCDECPVQNVCPYEYKSHSQ
jgi:endonuclease III